MFAVRFSKEQSCSRIFFPSAAQNFMLECLAKSLKHFAVFATGIECAAYRIMSGHWIQKQRKRSYARSLSPYLH
jgi:hypothetical protein